MIREISRERQEPAKLSATERPLRLQNKPAEIGVLGQIADVLFHVGGVDLDRLAGAVGRREARRRRARAPSPSAAAARRYSPRSNSPPRPMSATASMASSENSSVTPSVPISATYCLISDASGSVRMRRKSSRVSGLSSTRIGRRPCSSGRRSDGFAVWNAPEAMNRMWSVFTEPCLVGDGGAFDQRQQIALHAFARHVAADAAVARADLVDLVEEDDAVVLHRLDRLLRELFGVEQLVGFFVDEGFVGRRDA